MPRFFSAVMWNVYGDCDNYATMKGHSGAVMELHYNTDGRYEDNVTGLPWYTQPYSDMMSFVNQINSITLRHASE